MEISAKRMNKLTKLSAQGAMTVLAAGLPEFSKTAINDMKEEIELFLSDIIESHVSAAPARNLRRFNFKRTKIYC